MGGVSTDEAEAITSDANNNLYVTGNTLSSNFPTLNLTGAYTQNYEGSSSSTLGDAFLTAFSNNSLAMSWSTFVGGSSPFNNYGGDVAYSLSTFGNSKLYITGGSNSTTPNYPVSDPGGGAYYQPNGVGVSTIIITEFNLSSVVISVKELIEEAGVKLYPNPVTDNIIITNLENDYTLKIYNTIGQLVYDDSLEKNRNVVIDVSKWSKGNYNLIFNDKENNKISSAKIIVQ